MDRIWLRKYYCSDSISHNKETSDDIVHATELSGRHIEKIKAKSLNKLWYNTLSDRVCTI